MKPAEETISPHWKGARERMPIPSAPAAIGIYRPHGLPSGVEQILKIQGYTDLGRVRPAVRAAAETAAGIVGRAISPDARYRRIGVRSCVGGVLTLADASQMTCSAFDRYLAGCDEVIAFVLTLGGAIDRVEHNMASNGQMLETVLFEAAAWMAIEQATKRLTAHLRALVAPEGLTLSRRLAPGYSFGSGARRWEWPLTDQVRLFALFGNEPMPVQLLESCAMVPKMSRSGLLGLRRRQAEAA